MNQLAYSSQLAHELIVACQKHRYEEIARPLEPYVAVLVLFSWPPILMATDYCADRSGAKVRDGQIFAASAWTYGTCDVWCEFALSFRSLVSAAVYFYVREHREELTNCKTLCRRLGQRFTKVFCASKHKSVKFGSGSEPMLYADDRPVTYHEESVANEPSSSAPYTLMDDRDEVSGVVDG